VFAFLVAPPATASLLVKRVPFVMVSAVVIGACCAVVGLLISYHHSTATGATMALATVVVFLVALLVRQVVRGLALPTRRLASEHG
jgi:manganese/iron transport system permease protein